jgi:predicted phosphodiesterase
MTRIAVVSDVHGNLPALQAVVADMASRGIDRVVNLGDLASGPLWPRETVAYLMGQQWLTISGNHDRQVGLDDPSTHGPTDRFAYQELDPSQRAWLASLPGTALIEPELMMCHGTPTDDLTYLLETIDAGRFRLAQPGEIGERIGAVRPRLLLCGHSHVPRLVNAPGGTVIVNPGSVGLQAFRDHQPGPYLSETGSPSARYAIVEVTANSLRVNLLAIEYDHLAAASQAERNGSPQWGASLRSGYAWPQ